MHKIHITNGVNTIQNAIDHNYLLDAADVRTDAKHRFISDTDLEKLYTLLKRAMIKDTYDQNENSIVDRAEKADSVEWKNVTDKPNFNAIINNNHSHTSLAALNYITLGPDGNPRWRGKEWPLSKELADIVSKVYSHDASIEQLRAFMDGIISKINAGEINEEDAEMLNETLLLINTTLEGISSDLDKYNETIETLINDVDNIKAINTNNTDIVNAVRTSLDNKVDKVNGKDLSTNDFSDAYKSKLNNIANNANNYVHPTTSGNKHIPAGGSTGQILRWLSDGTAAWDNDNSNVNATSTNPGLMSITDKKKLDAIEENANNYIHPTDPGFNHIPAGGIEGQILRWNSDGSAKWGDETNSSYSIATPSNAGLMSADDKQKLDDINISSLNYTHPTDPGYKHIPVGGKSGQILRWDSDGNAKWDDEVSIVTYSNVTNTTDGLMKHEDKVKLDTISENANFYEHPNTSGNRHIPSGGKSGQILKWNSDGSAKWEDEISIVTYNKVTDVSDGLMSYQDKIKLDNIENNANNYVHPNTSGNKHIPSGGSAGQVLKWASDGTAVWDNEKDTTYQTATTSNDGLMSADDKYKLDNIANNANNYSHPTTSGNKHIPSGGRSGQILRWSDDGIAVWDDETASASYSDVTSSHSGLMLAQDKQKLDSIEENANNYIHPTDPGYKHIPNGGSDGQLLRWSNDGEAEWYTLDRVTSSDDGLMSFEDKNKLDTIEENANYYSHPTDPGYNHIPLGGSTGQVLKWNSNGEARWDNESSYNIATSDDDGLMSSTDKIKLNNIEENANKYVHPTTPGNNHIPSGGSANQVLKWISDGEAEWADMQIVTSNESGLMTAYDKQKLDTIEENANNYSHPTYTGYKHIPVGGSEGQILRWDSDGTAKWDNETAAAEYNIVTTTENGFMSVDDKLKLDSIDEGANKYEHPTTSGNIHIPEGGSEGQILRWNADGEAKWDDETAATTYTVVTSSTDGLMSFEDKQKIDNIEENANYYEHPTTPGNIHIPAGGSEGQILRWDSDGNAKWDDEVDTTYNVVTNYEDGLMIAQDKIKLDNIEENANNYSHPTTSGNKHIPSGGSAGQVLKWNGDGEAIWANDENTTYSNATQEIPGLMSADDKTKLDGITEDTWVFTLANGTTVTKKILISNN